ncbi:MAG: FAD-dependent oxidoreductase [Clostridia bacterium]|nr:FAD-dependent oxidoreductase [Clostridia bacterium]MDE7328541.1 FAD-dependent oxidoreductase [Clostridia bacterium]
MIKVALKLPVGYTQPVLERELAKALRIPCGEVAGYEILKKSLDSRNKRQIYYVVSVGVNVKNENKILANNKSASLFVPPIGSLDGLIAQVKPLDKPPVVIGAGPAGLFAGLTLAKAGLKPIIIERGKCVEERQKSVDDFIKTSVLDTQSNVQFGEGGAGTFSDGKLNTGTGSDKINVVLRELVKYGAPEQIVYDAKPHIGTDRLVAVVKNIRQDIIALGGSVLFDTQATDIRVKNGKLASLILRSKDKGDLTLDCDYCILAIGHSARDTFEMLSSKVAMQQKPFSIGARIEHLQENVDRAQYGDTIRLPPASYSLSAHLDNGRSCYTFCMCPGGYVMPATSEEGGVVTNGMSYFARDGKNANSALLVGVGPADFVGDNVLAGVEFQRKYERLAYALTGSYKAPCQRYGDLLNGKITKSSGEVSPTYPLGVEFADLRECLPSYVCESICQAVSIFDRKLKGFAHPDALLTGVESRSSSPVRILRDERGNASIYGLMPCGEGAGYAGGITSASVDGINVALNLIANACKTL